MTGSQCLHLPQYKRISKIEISSVMIMASNEMHGQWPFLYLHNILPAKDYLNVTRNKKQVLLLNCTHK